MGRPKLPGFADPAPPPRNGRPSPSGHAGSAEGCLAPSVEPVFFHLVFAGRPSQGVGPMPLRRRRAARPGRTAWSGPSDVGRPHLADVKPGVVGGGNKDAQAGVARAVRAPVTGRSSGASARSTAHRSGALPRPSCSQCFPSIESSHHPPGAILEDPGRVAGECPRIIEPLSPSGWANPPGQKHRLA